MYMEAPLKIECKNIDRINVENISHALSTAKADIFITVSEISNVEEILNTIDECGLIHDYVKNTYNVTLPPL